MIYTCTFAPAIDYTPYVDHFETGKLNRTAEVNYLPGGKGINVARVLSRLQTEVTAFGYVGGFTGAYLKQILQEQNIRTDFIETNEITRINVKIKSDVETELNGPSPIITSDMYAQLLKKVELLEENDWFVLSGTVPAGFDLTALLNILSSKGIQLVADIAGQVLHEIVPYRPVLVKPNLEELGDLFNTTLLTVDEAIPYAKQLIELGVHHVIVSLGGDGALFVSAEDVYYAVAPRGKVVNTVGAGDSVVAATIAMYCKTGDWQQAFRHGVAAGSATAFQLDLCKQQDVLALVKQVIVKKL
ncbi:1-phosphofructokinase [Solibacillus sp. NPDC093137]|uniref:1-phosphofructokinase n=1 Tax=Solibacillus sp. NPDC093137 TaxID=3390678 RepID=UPI003D00A3C4